MSQPDYHKSAWCRSAIFVAPVVAFVAYGCTYPSQTVEQGSGNGHLYFVAAPAGTTVFVDGRAAGDAASFDGVHAVLDVAPGPHHVVANNNGQAIYDHQIYVGADAKLAIKVQ